MAAQQIRISGIVQGVGFRPTVWRLAQEAHIVGEVWNDGDAVVIHAWAEAAQLDRFIQRLKAEPPPLARIEKIIRTPLTDGLIPPDTFRIVESRYGNVRTSVAADAATCPECLAELFDPANRRYRYPFINCTHCGPRLSIVRAIPYDRANTSMAAFPLCPACRAEYDDPVDRRFHAQPNACRECGPRLWLVDSEGQVLSPEGKEDAVELAARLIGQGKIVAIKGIGGFHLACDAGNATAVDTLRRRKQRYHKPFALMARDVTMVKAYADAGSREAALLQQHAAPIVLLKRMGDSLAEAVAPGQNTLGFMLPYTPLHHLLMAALPQPIVLTSGNRSDEPQVIDNDEALERLRSIADCFLLHDRDIVNRLDDSVARIADGDLRLLRRARGYAPQPIALPADFVEAGNILAMGAELKNTFCLLKQGKAILSQHLGDLENAGTLQDYRRNLSRYRRLFDFTPSHIAVDAHPDYLSTQLGQTIAAEENIPLIAVQHHHAHIAACMAEHGLSLDHGKVLGVALDGLGYGDDGGLWGGEFLLADYRGFERLACFQPVAMPGGAQATNEPWRNTYAHLATALDWEQLRKTYADLEIIRFLHTKPLTTMQTMMARNLNSPKASSAGRLFDAVAAALGLCRERAGYEGQAAIELEALAAEHFGTQSEYAYGYAVQEKRITWAPLWRSLLEDLAANVTPGIIAARFHHCIAKAVADTAARLCAEYQTETVILTGGVFQNRLLLEQSGKLLREKGLNVLSPSVLPANDGGLALGQAVVAHMVVR